MGTIPTCKADSISTSPNISCYLWNLKVHLKAVKGASLLDVMCDMKAVHVLKSSVLKVDLPDYVEISLAVSLYGGFEPFDA